MFKEFLGKKTGPMFKDFLWKGDPLDRHFPVRPNMCVPPRPPGIVSGYCTIDQSNIFHIIIKNGLIGLLKF